MAWKLIVVAIVDDVVVFAESEGIDTREMAGGI
jgi:hypothetical protein